MFFTTGGVFDTSVTAPTTGDPAGTIEIVWRDCDNATLTYNLNGLGLTGAIEAQRFLPNNIPLCEPLGQMVEG